MEGFAEFHANVKFEPDGGVGFGLPPNYPAYGIFNMGGLSLANMLSGDYQRLSPAVCPICGEVKVDSHVATKH